MLFSSFIYSEPFLENYAPKQHNTLPFSPPTERQLEYETPEKIKNSLNYQAYSGNWEFWNDIVLHEERGLFGYHAAKQEVRIFHDIVKMIFEEILDFEIKKDFYFLRVPLDPDLNEYKIAKDFIKAFQFIDDGIPVQRTQIVSMNYSLFGNYNDGSQCTVCYFAENMSWFQIDYSLRLKFLFDQLGIPLSEINKLKQAGSSITNFDTGVIYQMFDMSHHTPKNSPAYTMTNSQVYPAYAAGPLDKSVFETLSTVFQKTTPKKFDLNSGQLRLIMNTKTTLNPYGSLTIRRYDRINPELVAKYEQNLRTQVKKLVRDQAMVEIYKKKLKNKDNWNVK